MFIQLTTMLCAIQMLAKECKCLKFIDLPSDSDDPDKILSEGIEAVSSTSPSQSSTTSSVQYPPLKTSTSSPMPMTPVRRSLTVLRQHGEAIKTGEGDVTDYYLKEKISTLIDQTVHDITKKVASVQNIKRRIVEEPPYKAGYILSLVRKSRLMLNDLFNLAVKHRDNWKALQQLKVFEYIVHTNVDTTNLVRHLVEIHMQHLNSSQTAKKRVILL